MPRIELTEVERLALAKAGAQSIPCNNGWRPIETAPKTGDILLWTGFIHIGKYYEEYDCFYAYDIAPPLCYPTHWQPLPKPPKEKE